MKAELYAISKSNALSWYISLELEVDVQYWGAQREKYDMIRIEPLLSLGQAVICRERLSASEFSSSVTGQPYDGIKSLITECLRCSLKLEEISVNVVTHGCDLQVPNEQVPYQKIFNPKVLSPKSLDPIVMEQLSSHLQGRSLLSEEIVDLMEHLGLGEAKTVWKEYIQWAYLLGKVDILNGLSFTRKRSFPYLKWTEEYFCRRCGSGKDHLFWSQCASCGENCAYCEACLTMGRMRSCSLLVNGIRTNSTSCNKVSLYNMDETAPLGLGMRQWKEQLSYNCTPATGEAPGARSTPHGGGQPHATIGKEVNHTSLTLQKWNLSPCQLEAAEAGIQFLMEPKKGKGDLASAYFLIWAVTGAGKTEMIFPLIEAELARGGNVLLATPRRDVVLELEPRIRRAFSANRLVALYGGSEQRWEPGEITLATTHQLLRFWQEYDLVIIDEMDAYPFHNNPMLEFAAQKAGKPSGKYILLSATPPAALQKAAKQHKLPHIKVPVRHHRHPLPVPRILKVNPLRKITEGRYSRKPLPQQLRKALDFSVDRGAQIFIFVPHIKSIDPFVHLLRAAMTAEICIEGTSSQDTERRTKVLDFREGDIRILVTTTILERGVTVPRTDVFVMDADSPMFDEAALVQMAGRAGRSSDDPKGQVYYAAYERTKAQNQAVRHIVKMNRLARNKGYLIN